MDAEKVKRQFLCNFSITRLLKNRCVINKQGLKMKIGNAFRLVIKSDGTLYPRTKGVNRTSTRVKEINGLLRKAAEKCKNQKLGKFKGCIADEMRGKKAAGSDAASYVYAKAHR